MRRNPVPIIVVVIVALIPIPVMAFCRYCSTPAPGSTGPRTDAIVVGKFTDWKQYSMEAYGVTFGDLDPTLYTHMIISTVSIQNGLCFIDDAWMSLQKPFSSTRLGSDTSDIYKGLFNQARRMKQRYPHVKAIVEIRDVDSSTTMSQAASSSASRNQAVTSCVNLMIQYGFDGINILWDGPNRDGSTPQDVNNYVLFVSDLRAAIQNSASPSASLSITVIFDPTTLSSHFNLAAMLPYLDFITVRNYYYWGSWATSFGHWANLNRADPQSPEQRSVTDDIQTFLDLSIPSCKIVMSIPTGTHAAWVMSSSPPSISFPALYSINTLQQSGSGSLFGEFADVDLEPARRHDPGWSEIWDSTARASVYYNDTTRTLISAESQRSAIAKTQFAIDRNLAGVMIDDTNADAKYNHIAAIVSQAMVTGRPCRNRSTTRLTTQARTWSSTRTTPPTSAPSTISWTYPPMPNLTRSPSGRSSPLSQPIPAPNHTQVDVPIWAQLVSIPLERSLSKYTQDRIKTELAFFVADAAAVMGISPTQIVNCLWVSVSSSSSVLTFTLLPNEEESSSALAARFTRGMKDEDGALRQCALLQFAPLPIAVSTSSIQVRICSNNVVTPASSRCSQAQLNSENENPVMGQMMTIIISVAVTVIFGGVGLYWYRRRRAALLNQKKTETQRQQESCNLPTGLEEKLVHGVASLPDMPSIPSSDDTWQVQQHQIQAQTQSRSGPLTPRSGLQTTIRSGSPGQQSGPAVI